MNDDGPVHNEIVHGMMFGMQVVIYSSVIWLVVKHL